MNKLEAGIVKREAGKLRKKLISLKTSATSEARETYVAAEILIKLLEDKPVSEEQIKFLKEQSVDVAKVLAIIGLQAVPGSSIAIIVLERFALKHGFTLFPKTRKMPDIG